MNLPVEGCACGGADVLGRLGENVRFIRRPKGGGRVAVA